MRGMRKISETAGQSFFLMFLLVQIVQAEPGKWQDPEYLFFKATGFYEAGKYDDAIEQYQLLVKQSLESGPLYYNLGNCYLKKKELGKAILNYERAKKIFPTDPDLGLNYQYAKSLTQLPPAGDDPSWYSKGIDKFSGTITIDQATILLSALYVFAVSILIAGLFIAGVRRYFRIILGGLFIFFILVGLTLANKVMLLEKEAVVIREKVDVKFEPFDRAATYFVLHEGMKVQVILSKKDWMKVRYPDKRVGWVKASGIEVI
jgi:tetratricopeptide (TPR) repeat protein